MSDSHGHSKPKPGTTEWYFHFEDHEELTHCEGGEKNPYKIKHVGEKPDHGINKEYARGHGFNKEPTWFKFADKIGKLYNLASGEKLDVADVPDTYKAIYNKQEGIHMPGLITQELKLKDIFPSLAATVLKDYNFAEEPVLIRKGLIPSDLKFDEGERSSIDYITTADKDRDNEVVDPAGCILSDYMKNPVVLFGHDHRGMPVGKCAWIKSDMRGLVAKTIYANTAQANEIYEYRKAGFPMAKSIGFIPIETMRFQEGSPEYAQGVYRKYTKWLLLEYSDVPVPSNPEALQVAISKGLLKPEEATEYTIVLADEPEEKTAPDNITGTVEEPPVRITSTEAQSCIPITYSPIELFGKVISGKEYIRFLLVGKEILNFVDISQLPEEDLYRVRDFIASLKSGEPPIEKAGRVLSAKTRAAMESACTAMDEAGKAMSAAGEACMMAKANLEALMAESEPMEEPEDHGDHEGHEEEPKAATGAQEKQTEPEGIQFDFSVPAAKTFNTNEVAAMVREQVGAAFQETLIPAVTQAAKEAINIRRGRLG